MQRHTTVLAENCGKKKARTNVEKANEIDERRETN